ncbi:MAG: TetR family transcriptional regulator [Eggerthellaceae bacterium]|nr:TetR family transcriptional regulator [Eggerthellaceae bacterium]
MAEPRNTKRMFADELEAMMEETPLSKVRVRDLCARCGVERCTFYYHFKDKYDLVAWMLDQESLRAAEGARRFTRAHFAEGLRLIWERRAFYRRAFEEGSQNSIYRHHLEYCIRENEALLRRHLGVKDLSRTAAFEARFFSLGTAGSLGPWLAGEIVATPEQLTDSLFDCMPPTLRKAYAAQAKLEGDAR